MRHQAIPMRVPLCCRGSRLRTAAVRTWSTKTDLAAPASTLRPILRPSGQLRARSRQRQLELESFQGLVFGKKGESGMGDFGPPPGMGGVAAVAAHPREAALAEAALLLEEVLPLACSAEAERERSTR